MLSLTILSAKIINFLCQTFNLGSGSTWPGHIALKLNKNIVKTIIKKNPQL